MAIPEFPVNIQRDIPYPGFAFQVIIDNRVVAGVSKVSPLKRTTGLIEHRDGNDPLGSRKMPGVTKFDAVTLERGVTNDHEFEQWANKVWNTNGPASGTISLLDFKKDITIQLLNEQGTPVLSYLLYRCWVVEFIALPQLDANGSGVAIESIKIETEGWERDEAVTEQLELKID